MISPVPNVFAKTVGGKIVPNFYDVEINGHRSAGIYREDIPDGDVLWHAFKWNVFAIPDVLNAFPLERSCRVFTERNDAVNFLRDNT